MTSLSSRVASTVCEVCGLGPRNLKSGAKPARAAAERSSFPPMSSGYSGWRRSLSSSIGITLIRASIFQFLIRRQTSYCVVQTRRDVASNTNDGSSYTHTTGGHRISRTSEWKPYRGGLRLDHPRRWGSQLAVPGSSPRASPPGGIQGQLRQAFLFRLVLYAKTRSVWICSDGTNPGSFYHPGTPGNIPLSTE